MSLIGGKAAPIDEVANGQEEAGGAIIFTPLLTVRKGANGAMHGR